MTIKTLLTASVLMLVPMMAQAQCMWDHGSQEAAISCADGTTWDAASMTCVAVASS
ncbi:adenylosuccinate lyase [Gymnodinialimonas hymeniacidonis]|uniref:adenylosuccinate lyase n=1 Tax=Gymnodinialimonas hymeniacidonis TaxID=3126508 RepID=UPI0034C68569